jgi:virulence factor
MVGFNRRFAPLYQQLKAQSGTLASLRMDKHRTTASGRTICASRCWMIICTLWIRRCGWQRQCAAESGTLLTNEQGEMVYAEHHFR